MAIVTAICDSFLLELAQAIHDFTSDEIKVALYVDTADLGASTTVYSSDDEASGSGYTAGGVVATVREGYPQVVGHALEVRFDLIEWESATLTYRGALVYNATKDNRAIAVLDRGMSKTVTNGTITISDFAPLMPLVRIAAY